MRYVIGIGSGRCGTKSLAKFLDIQAKTKVSHESYLHLPWVPERKNAELILRELDKRAAIWGSSVIGEVASYYLNHLPFFFELVPDLKVICMKRNKEDCVRSICRMPNWFAPTGCQIEGFLGCFPTYDLPPEEAAAKYYDEYYARVDRLLGKYPILMVQLEEFCTVIKQRQILDFVGYETGSYDLGIHLNKGEEKCGIFNIPNQASTSPS